MLLSSTVCIILFVINLEKVKEEDCFIGKKVRQSDELLVESKVVALAC